MPLARSLLKVWARPQLKTLRRYKKGGTRRQKQPRRLVNKEPYQYEPPKTGTITTQEAQKLSTWDKFIDRVLASSVIVRALGFSVVAGVFAVCNLSYTPQKATGIQKDRKIPKHVRSAVQEGARGIGIPESQAKNIKVYVNDTVTAFSGGSLWLGTAFVSFPRFALTGSDSTAMKNLASEIIFGGYPMKLTEEITDALKWPEDVMLFAASHELSHLKQHHLEKNFLLAGSVFSGVLTAGLSIVNKLKKSPVVRRKLALIAFCAASYGSLEAMNATSFDDEYEADKIAIFNERARSGGVKHFSNKIKFNLLMQKYFCTGDTFDADICKDLSDRIDRQGEFKTLKTHPPFKNRIDRISQVKLG